MSTYDTRTCEANAYISAKDKECFPGLSLICLIWRQALKDLVVQCWDADPEKRPNFEQIIIILEGLLKKIPREPSSGSGGCCSIQ